MNATIALMKVCQSTMRELEEDYADGTYLHAHRIKLMIERLQSAIDYANHDPVIVEWNKKERERAESMMRLCKDGDEQFS